MGSCVSTRYASKDGRLNQSLLGLLDCLPKVSESTMLGAVAQ